MCAREVETWALPTRNTKQSNGREGMGSDRARGRAGASGAEGHAPLQPPGHEAPRDFERREQAGDFMLPDGEIGNDR